MAGRGRPTVRIKNLLDLAQLVADAWAVGADRDWTTVPAGTLEWDCWHTADHAINAVIAPAFVLASRRTDRLPDLGSGFHVDPDATPNQFVERLLAAAQVLSSVITAAEPTARAVIFFPRPIETAPPEDFAPRGGLELILHAHDVCAGLAIPFEPPADLCARLRDHTATWRIWTSHPPVHPWNVPPVTDDPWADLLAGSGRRRSGVPAPRT